jgi:hypothetical protein
MKKVIFIFAIILTALTSCEKEEITVSETSKPQNKEILTFATQEEFEETLAKVNAMSKEERLAWEKEQGFKSFGTISDEFYETIDFENCKTIDDVKKHDPENKFLDIFIESGVYHVGIKEQNTTERFIANSDKIFIVGDRAVKLLDSKYAYTNISDIQSLKKINTFSEFESAFYNSKQNENSFPNAKKVINIEEYTKSKETSNYKTKVTIQTENFWAFFPDRTEIETEFTITNYKKGIFGFYEQKLATYYHVELYAYDEVSGKACNVFGDATNHDINSYNKSQKVFVCDGWTNKYDPRFDYINVDVRTVAGNVIF